MKFEMIFSGPCAYVPNRLAGDPDPAPSWSAILPDASLGMTVGEVEIAPHYTVLKIPDDLFELTGDIGTLEILRFQKDDGPMFAAIRLKGHEVRIETGNPVQFEPVFIDLPQEVLEDPSLATPAQMESLNWLPAIEELLPGAGTVGNADEVFFENTLPTEGNIAARVILDQGRLVTHSLLPDTAPANEPPSIWGFRAFPGHPSIATQAVAHAVTLQIDPLTAPLIIHLADADHAVEITLKKGLPADQEVSVEVKNREMDEIVQFADGEIEVDSVDRDFKSLYLFSGMEQESGPLPFLRRGGGVGSLRTTCGGARFEGFGDEIAAALNFPAADGGGGL